MSAKLAHMKRSVGRPALDAETKREHKIIIRVTREELAEAQDAAKLEGESLSTLGREILMPALRRRVARHV